MRDNDGKDPVIRKAMKQWKLSADAEMENRKRFIFAKKFALGGEYQWDPEIYSLRGLDNLPRDSYNQIPQFTHQVTNDGRMNDTETKFVPGDDADEETAEKREDLARNIQSGPEAAVAYETALENSTEGGWGYWRYITEYENSTSFNQIIKLRWVPNPLTVYDDPNTFEQNRLDRLFLFEVADMPIDDFNSEYRKDKPKYGSSDLESIGDSQADWASDETIRVAEYWSVEKEFSTLYRNKKTGKTTSDKPDDVDNYDTRDVVKNKVVWRKITACEVLEERDWPGEYIPYVFIAGEEKVVDGRRHLTGLVEHMIAPQKAFNYQSNSVIHMTALAPKSPWIAPSRAINGLEQFWDESNVRNYAYLPYNDVDEKGQPVPAPQRTPAGTDISAGVALIQQAQQNFYNCSGIFPASLGKQGNEQSGKAIMARQREGDVSTFHLIDNQTRGKLAGGIIMNDLIPKIYDGSRVVTVKKADGRVDRLAINQEYKSPKGETKMHDMTAGTYEVMITTGPSYTTKRQESAETLLQLASQTNLMEVAPDLVYDTMDFPGHDKIAERYKRTLPPALTEDENEDPIPPQVKQQMEQMGQTIQQLQQALQVADQQVQSKEGELQLKQADLQLKMQDLQAGQQSDAMKAETDRMKLQLDQQKVALDAEKLQLERDKMELDAIKMQLDFKTQQTQAVQPQTGGDDMGLSKEALLKQIESMEMQESQAQQDQLVQQQLQAQAEQERMMKEEEERAKSEALLQSLSQIQQSLQMLTMSITAPKTVVRDPQTGLVQGVVTGSVN